MRPKARPSSVEQVAGQVFLQNWRAKVNTEWVAVRGHWCGVAVKILRNGNRHSVHVRNLKGTAHKKADRDWMIEWGSFWPYYEPKHGALEDNIEPWPADAANEPEMLPVAAPPTKVEAHLPAYKELPVTVPVPAPAPAYPPPPPTLSVVRSEPEPPPEPPAAIEPVSAAAILPSERIWRVRYRELRWVEAEDFVTAGSLLDVAAIMEAEHRGADVIGVEVAE